MAMGGNRNTCEVITNEASRPKQETRYQMPSGTDKGKQKQNRRAQQEAEREKKIQEEQSDIVSDSMIENEKPERKPKPTSDFLSENLVGDSHESLAQKFENYCKEVGSTAIRGGQLELGALRHCLKKHIMIFSGSLPDVEMGKERVQI
ncbi:hypothetical protein L6164_010179 [Bauhinia variegata]|uniref:Uncharacterized protein n=1 Tax=Bauhinia variegata TaxID=167791 RepID=A0ACB9PMH2_BAUVA|nr:hypothetical protein L6164_010179 [Bauhinia variegata]